MFDFTKVREVDGKRSAGFEELCVHLFEALCESPVRGIDRVNGAGGDGGVEAIATTGDGCRVGLQSKYFVDALGSSQWQQIKHSLEQSMKNHPDLGRYFVCVPRDRTPGQIRKWDELVRGWKSDYPKLTITWVGRSELSRKLVMPESSYLATYWVNAPEFSMQWLSVRVEAAISQLHRRFTPDLHNETRAEVALSRAFGFNAVLQEYREQCSRLAVEANKLLPQIEIVELAPEAQDLASLCDDVVLLTTEMLQGIADGDLTKQEPDYAEVLHKLSSICSQLGMATSAEHDRLRELKAPDSERNKCGSISRDAFSVSRFAEELLGTIWQHHHAKSKPVWLLMGEAGSGKSHLLGTLTRRTLEEGHAAIFLLGEQFLDVAPLPSQICEQLGWAHSFDELLSCLRARAQQVGRPSVLVIDAINETPTRNLWLSQLVNLRRQIANYPGVHLLLSCRDDWVEACVPTVVRTDAEEFQHGGFDLNFAQVVSAYFDGYNVSADAFPPLVPEFRNPLFLKTVCETYEDRKLPAKPLSFLEVLAAWENRICEKIERAIDCPVAQSKVAIQQILMAMADERASNLPEQTAREYCFAAYPQPASSQSLYRYLQSFGFMQEVRRGPDTFVRLQYERFYDVRVAQAELEQVADTAAWHNLWQQMLPKLGTWEHDAVSPARLFAFALLLPERFGVELVECTLPLLICTQI